MTDLIHEPETCKLGKKLGVVNDPRTLMLKKFVSKSAFAAAPKTFDAGKNVNDADWQMYGNDQYGDCVPAAEAHTVMALMAASGRTGYDLTDNDVIHVYSALSGFDPATGANDNGAYLLDALNYWRKTGIGSTQADRGANEHRIAGFVKLDIKNLAQMRTACWLFGPIYIGLALPITAQRQRVWDTTGSTSGDAAPGSWGGHCVTLAAYRSADWDCITWGSRKKLTDAFLSEYCDEAYAVVSHDWINRRTWKAPAGVKFDALMKELSQFGQVG